MKVKVTCKDGIKYELKEVHDITDIDSIKLIIIKETYKKEALSLNKDYIEKIEIVGLQGTANKDNRNKVKEWKNKNIRKYLQYNRT